LKTILDSLKKPPVNAIVMPFEYMDINGVFEKTHTHIYIYVYSELMGMQTNVGLMGV